MNISGTHILVHPRDERVVFYEIAIDENPGAKGFLPVKEAVWRYVFECDESGFKEYSRELVDAAQVEKDLVAYGDYVVFDEDEPNINHEQWPSSSKGLETIFNRSLKVQRIYRLAHAPFVTMKPRTPYIPDKP